VNFPFHQLNIPLVCHYINLPFYLLPILSLSHFINVPFHQLTFLSTCLSFCKLSLLSTSSFITLPFHQLANLSTCNLIILPIQTFAISSTCYFINWPFYQLANSSTCHFIILTFHQLAISPNYKKYSIGRVEVERMSDGGDAKGKNNVKVKCMLLEHLMKCQADKNRVAPLIKVSFIVITAFRLNKRWMELPFLVDILSTELII
jgi:hypothetical protein